VSVYVQQETLETAYMASQPERPQLTTDELFGDENANAFLSLSL
jgi:hypothetical protein